MTFTGNLIEDLMTTVERAEQGTQRDEPLFAEALVVDQLLSEPLLRESLSSELFFSESWLASIQKNAEYDSNFIGVA